MGCTYAVAACIAAAYHQHVLALCGHQILCIRQFALQDAVLLAQQVKCQMHAFQFPSRDVEVACGGSACSYHIGIVLANGLLQLFHAEGIGLQGYSHAVVELYSFGLHQVDTSVDDLFL